MVQTHGNKMVDQWIFPYYDYNYKFINLYRYYYYIVMYYITMGMVLIHLLAKERAEKYIVVAPGEARSNLSMSF